MQSSIFFLYGDHPRTGKRGVGGTGALIGLNHPQFDPQQQFTREVYAVTAAHVVRGGGSVIRLNTKDGKSRYIELDPAEWAFSHNDDLAAVDITDHLTDNDQVVVIHETWLADRAIIDYYDISFGEDGFMLGLFFDIVGDERNVITGRFGNVSLIARADAPIEYANGRRPAHLFDMKSRPGFSGSPVFVYRTPSHDLRLIDQGPEEPYLPGLDFALPGRIGEMDKRWKDRQNTFIKVLGIHIGQYTDMVTVSRNNAISHEVSEFVRDGDLLKIPNSMAVVTTADAIRELLAHPSLSALRATRDAAQQPYSEQVLIERTIYSGWLSNRGR